MWTKSACVVLAWSMLLGSLLAAGIIGTGRPAQADIRIAGSIQAARTSTPSTAVTSVTAQAPGVRYAVWPGNTLSGIAARFAVPGGWAALYAANRRAIGPDPDLVRPGTVLAITGLKAQAQGGPATGGAWPPGRPAAPQPVSRAPGHLPGRIPGRSSPPAAAGLPGWLTAALAAVVAAGLVAVAAGLVLAARRRRRADGIAAGHARPVTQDGRIVLADYDRLVVTYSHGDRTVYVLRPPGTDPRTILQAARLVLPEASYGELAEQLGVPASWPMQ